MKEKTYHLITYGCQMNKSDSERIVAVLENAGLKKSTISKADFVVLNLCSVRQHAIDRVFGKINYIKTLKSAFAKATADRRQNIKTKKIILTGCILDSDKKKFKDRVDYILDINELQLWPQQLGLENSHIHSHTFASKFACSPNYQSKISVYLPIMTGCSNFCTYCVVPYVRGFERPRKAQEILSEFKALVSRNYKMITLLGQNVNSYHDEDEKITFPKLLKIIDKASGNYWLSFITSHPKDLSDDLIKCFKDCQHLIPYLHLPIQSGSDKILKAMNRKYTSQQYLKLVERVRRAVPNITLSTDIIVGFPGETRKDFEQTVAVMKKVKFDMAYIAQYSPRAGTAANKLDDDVPLEEKKKCEKILTDILKQTAEENNKKMIGQTIDVLIERVDSGHAFGRTKNFKNVKINVTTTLPEASSPRDLIGKFIKVKIIKAGPWSLEGEFYAAHGSG